MNEAGNEGTRDDFSGSPKGFDLASQIEHLEDVVEDLVQGQSGHRPATPTREMRQDEFVEQRIVQFHGNPVSRLTFRHLDSQRIGILANLPHAARAMPTKATRQFQASKKPASSWW